MRTGVPQNVNTLPSVPKWTGDPGWGSRHYCTSPRVGRGVD